MSERLPPPLLRYLQGAACVVILMWGIKTASGLLVILLLGITLAYAFAPLPNRIMQQFKLRKNAALALTIALLGTLSLITVFLSYNRVILIREKLPIYQEHFTTLYEKVEVFLNAHGVDLASFSVTKLSTSDKILEFIRAVLPRASSFLADGLLISVLALIFLTKMVEQSGAKKDRLAETLAYYGADVRRYIGISAKTGIITALANLVVLVAVGVDCSLLWCVLYFFLHFIPSLGYILALVPPVFLALLMLGWKKALLVGGSLILSQVLTDYGLTPILMRKGVAVSFLEMTVSLMFWGFLLGPVGAILAVPLTLTLKKFVEQFSTETGTLSAPPVQDEIGDIRGVVEVSVLGRA
jgi:AI-2 transport protein TqsA